MLCRRFARPDGCLASGPALIGVPAVAFWTVALTALYPIWFAQSTLAHADIFAAACTLWGLVYALPARNRLPPRKPWAAALCFSAAALSKETAIAIPLTLAAVSLFESFRAPGMTRIRLWREAAWLAGCMLPLAAWYAYHCCKTGFLFGNPEFLRYNAQANLDPAHPGRLRPPHPASDRAHEPLCAGADGDGRAAACAEAGEGNRGQGSGIRERAYHLSKLSS